jgi:hypothetical protein
MPITQQLNRVRNSLWAVEEVVYPMGGVCQERLGLNFVPPIFGHDSKDERMDLHVLIRVYGAGRRAEFKQAGLGKQMLKFRFTSSHRCDDLSPARDCSVKRCEV